MLILRIITCIIVICCTGLSAQGENQSDPIGIGRWESLGARDGVKLARKSIRGNDLFAVRGEAMIPHPVSRVASVIDDHTRWAEWASGMMAAELLERDKDGTKVVYQAFDMPMLISDRDMIYKFGMAWEGTQLKIVGHSVEHPGAPPTVGIRTNLITGRWSLEPKGPDKTHLVLEVLMDPMGSLPSWLVNIVQRDYPADTILNLKSQLNKRDISPIRLPPRSTVTRRTP